MKLKLSIESLSEHHIVLMAKVFHLLLWQQWRFKFRKLTFNPIYVANQFGVPFMHLDISISLRNSHADLKNILYIIFFKANKT